MRKIITTVLVAIVAIGSVFAQGATEEKKESIDVLVTYTDVRLEKFQSLVDAFEKESGIDVNLITPGNDYENQLKTMMASNSMPDVWTTHGWSLLRYREYLKVVNKQPWFNTMDTDSLGGVMADENGNFYALGVSMAISGLIYNKDVLDAAGVDPLSLTTWKAFEKACDKILAAGYTPIVVGGSVSGNRAGMLGGIAPTYWTDKGAKYDLSASLINGTFDFDKYGTELYKTLADWLDKGYFNKDILTLDGTGAQKLLGAGKAAFMMRGSDNIAVAKSYYPNANLGIMPMPASADGYPSFRVGENDAFGVWKDTKHEDACWKFLAYLAKPEVATEICNMQGAAPGIKGVTLTDSYAYDAYQNTLKALGGKVQFDNIFDRKYFPSGMWGIMGTSMSMLIENTKDVPSAVNYLKDNYKSLWATVHNK